MRCEEAIEDVIVTFFLLHPYIASVWFQTIINTLLSPRDRHTAILASSSLLYIPLSTPILTNWLCVWFLHELGPFRQIQYLFFLCVWLYTQVFESSLKVGCGETLKSSVSPGPAAHALWGRLPPFLSSLTQNVARPSSRHFWTLQHIWLLPKWCWQPNTSQVYFSSCFPFDLPLRFGATIIWIWSSHLLPYMSII